MAAVTSLYRNGFYAMATRFYMLLPGMDSTTGDQLYQTIKSEVNRIESRLSRFINKSEISKINKMALKQMKRFLKSWKPVNMDGN